MMSRLLAVAWAIVAIAMSAIPAKSDISLSPIVNPRPLVSGNSLVATGPNSLSSSGATYYASAWGVKCDGSTDTTSALQAAETAINAAGGGTLVFPAGTCMVSNVGISKLSNVYWQGQGVGQTIIKMMAGSYTITHAAIQAAVASNFGVSDMTFDYSLATTTGNNAVFGVQNGNNWYFRNNSIIGVKVFGFSMSLGSNFDVSGNYCNDPSPTGAFDNECFLFSTAAGQNSECSLRNNVAIGSAIDVSGLCDIVGNYVTGWGFGAGITIEQDSNTHNMLVADNQAGVSLVAQDVNGVWLQGMEIWAPKAIIRNNRFWSNCGNGADIGSPESIVEGNYAWDNGTCVAGAGAQNGFVTRYTNGSVNGNGSEYVDNYAWDDGAGTQLYGYKDASSSTSVYIGPNSFSGVTAGTSIASVGGNSYPGPIQINTSNLLGDSRSIFSAGTPGTAAGAFTIGSTGEMFLLNNIAFTNNTHAGFNGNSELYWSGNVTGTCNLDNYDVCAVFSHVANSYNVVHSSGTSEFFNVDANWGGNVNTGTGILGSFRLSYTGGSADTYPSGVTYVALSSLVQAEHPVGNSSGGNNIGNFFAGNFQCLALAAATNIISCTGAEFDIVSQSGDAVQFLAGVTVDELGMSFQTASIVGDAFQISGQGPGAWDFGLDIGNYQGYMAIKSGGTIIGCEPHMGSGNCIRGDSTNTVAHGVDFSLLAFSSDAFKSPGFLVDGSGNVTSPAYETSTALITATNGSSTAAFTANMIAATGGPTTTAQNGWVKMKDSSGATIWIPEWK